MRTSFTIGLLVVIVGWAYSGAAQDVTPPVATAQNPVAKPAEPTRQRKRVATPTPPRQLIIETVPTAPQVVTLLHRLSGLKMFRLLVRSGDVRAIARLDESFVINGRVHTNVIAGLALDDGETITAWLPEVEAEMAPPPPPRAPRPPKTARATAATQPADSIPPEQPPGETAAPLLEAFKETPDLTVVARDRRKMVASYVGLDGITGLSVLKLARNSLPGLQSTIYAKESSIVVGQQVHIFGPEPVARGEVERDGPVYVKLGETEGKITRISRVPSGGIARVEITSAKVSAVNTGAVVLNDAGETVGIIDSVKGNAATVLPAALIRGAARRVLEKQASVPRPWLGIRGELLGAFPVEQLLRNGWESQKARLLAEQRRGILLTSVAPGSPAWTAALHPGDVILEVNRGEVRSAEDFSWFLEEAGPGGSLQFTVARPGSGSTEAIEVKLSESPDPLFGVRTPQFPSFVTPGARSSSTPDPAGIGFAPGYSPLANGVETIAILPKVAARWGSTGGLLVVYVEPSTFAYRAGLRTGDVIESINGQLVSADPEAFKMLDKPGGSYEFRVVRNKQKLQFVVITHEGKQ